MVSTRWFTSRHSGREETNRASRRTLRAKRSGQRLLVEHLEDRTLLTTAVWTDLPDYGAGDTATITGREFGAAENVQVRIVQDGTTEVGNFLAATDALGNFQNLWTVCDCAGAALQLTATGLTSGLTAATNFTDSPKIGSVAVGPQTGTTPTYGTGGSATYTVTVNRGSGSGSTGAFTALLSTSGLPSGVSGSFSPASLSFASGDSSKTATLTLSTSATTPASPSGDSFTVKATVSTASSDNKTASGSLKVNKGNTTTTITSESADPTVVGQSYVVNFTVAKVTGSVTPTDGSVTVSDGTGATCTDGSLTATGTGSCTLTSTSAGAKTLTATYNGSSNFNGSSGTAAHQVNAANTSTTVTSSDASSFFGQPVTFTATINPVSPSTATINTGTVQFKIDGANFGSPVAVSGGHATSSSNSSLSVGSHIVVAIYTDGTSYNSSTSPNLTQTVNTANTSTNVTSSDSTSKFGQAVTFTATVNGTGGSTATINIGSVQFKIDGVNFGSPVAVSGGSATSGATSSLSVATHVITAVYSDGTSYNGSSDTMNQVVSKANTSTTNTSNFGTHPTTVFGQPVTFTATVTTLSPGSGVPTGTVQFKDNAILLATVTVTATGPNTATATFTTSSLSVSAPGHHDIFAFFTDGTNFNSSNSDDVDITVNKANTSTVVSSSVNPSVFGQTVTFTATVSGTGGSTATVNIGSVQFKIDGVNFGSPVSVAGGTATSGATSSLSVGTHTITAAYTDGPSYNNSTSPNFIQTVNAADTSTAVSSSLNPSVYGQSVSFVATVSVVSPGAGTVTGTVQFKVDGVNFGSAVTVSGGTAASGSTSLLSAGSHTVTAVFTDGTNFNGSTGTLSGGQTVNKAHLTVTAGNASREYGDTNPAFTATLSGFVNGETLASSGVTGSASCSSAATPTSSVAGSPYTISCTQGTLAASNYDFTPFVNGQLTITKAHLTVTADPASRFYGDADPAFTATLSGFKNGETLATSGVTGGASCSSNSVATSPVAGNPYTIACTVGTLAAGNYDFPAGNFVSGALTVLKAHLAVTADNQTRFYGDANPALTATLSGFKNGETLATSGVTGSASCTTAATPTSPVSGSPYTISCTQGTLAAGNYDFTPFVAGALTVLKAHLAVTADNQTRFYGDANPALTATLGGFKNGETLATSGVTGSASCSTAATATSPVSGSPYTISCTQGTLAAGNYDFTPFVDGALTVLKAHLSVTADNQARVYGVANPALTATLNGFKNGETLATSGVTGSASCSTAATPSSAVGSYTISCTQGSLAAGNYDFTPFLDGSLTVTKRTTATAVSFAANPINEGSSTTVTVTVTDTNGAALVNVDPSGTAALSSTGTISLGGGSCTLVGNGSGAASCSVTVTGVDNPGGSVTGSYAGDATHFASLNGSAALTVNNVAPTLGALSITGGSITAPSPMQLGTVITASASYNDPGTLDTQTCYYTWDDGSTSTVSGSAAGTGSCSTTHTYTSAGVYQVTLKVTDKDGADSNTQIFQYVIIFDPNGGFITGGGWSNPTATTRANFGFNAKYLNSGALQGQNEFNYQAGNLNFHGVVNNYLVITPNGRAQYQATGTVNGAGSYTALVTAWDDSTLSGCTGDRYRITIKNGATVVFDNGSGSEDVDTCPPPITNGSIVVHSGALTAPGGQGSGQGEALTPEQLAPIVAAAQARWEAAGLSAAQQELLRQTPVRLASLSGGMVGWTTEGAILINTHAAGHGWFIDPTPDDDIEFGLADSPAQGRVDLLSVVTHEMGHVLGLEHSHDGGVMDEILTAGVRHVPGAVQALQVAATVGDPAVSLRLLDTMATAPASDRAVSAAPVGQMLDLPLSQPFAAAAVAPTTGTAQEGRLSRVLGEVTGSALNVDLLDQLVLGLVG